MNGQTIIMAALIAVAIALLMCAALACGKRTTGRREHNKGTWAPKLKVGFAGLRSAFSTPRALIHCANIAEGTHAAGCITKLVDAAITERFLLCKIGSAADHIAVCGAADTPLGIVTDEAAAVDDVVNVQVFGGSAGTVRMVASAAISQGALLEPAATGRVATLGAGSGTHHVVGRALDAAGAAGDVIEVMPCYFLRVIP